MNQVVKDELAHLLLLLKTEEEEDRQQYQERVLRSPIAERKKLGITWYPIVIKDTYYGIGERLIIEIERPTDRHVPHQFQTGRLAAIFSNQQGEDHKPLRGVVAGSGKDFIKLTLSVDELPDWASRGKIGVDVLFDEASYREMRQAVKHISQAENNRLAYLRDVLLGQKAAQFKPLQPNVSLPTHLNVSQQAAVQNIYQAEDVAIIHGPPGTGKTTTLIEAIKLTLQTEKQVLVCAPSNNAVDLLTEKLAQQGVNVLRFGNPARVSEHLLAHTIDSKISTHRDFKLIKEYKKRASEFRNMASKYKRNFGRDERSQRKLLFDEAYKIIGEADKIESFIVQDLVEKAQVITCTLVGSANYLIRERQYSTVFIDEAAQALEPACWIPIARAHRVVMAGDHQQLPPTVKASKSGREGLFVTLFEKTIARQAVDVMLQTQYRMNSQIMDFPNREFYEGKLEAGEQVKQAVLNPQSADTLLAAPVEFVDTAGCGYEEKYEGEFTSAYNPEEADLLLRYLDQLLTAMRNDGLPIPAYSIGVISPYKAQVNLLKEKLKAHPLLSQDLTNIAINTVDGFQGQERDIICISLVRSNDRQEIGFLTDYRRMNVAMTRARKKLVVIGDSSTLAGNPFYERMLAYMDEIQAYNSAWSYAIS